MNLQPPWPTVRIPYLLLFTSETHSIPVNLLSPDPIHYFWVLPILGYKANVQRIATVYLSALASDVAGVIETQVLARTCICQVLYW